MKSSLPLDDIALFLAVADGGSLSAASRATGTSLATLNRRMTALERRMERRLFERGPNGYALTAAGRELLTEARPLADVADRIERLLDMPRAARVRITAGFWTSRLLATQIASAWSPADDWVPEFVTSTAMLDIARREADIGIRNRRPEQSWLAGLRTSHVKYARYARSDEVKGYVVLNEDGLDTPSNRWVKSTYSDAIVTTVSDPRMTLDLAVAGVARAVLPTFIGDTEPELFQIGPTIDDLTHEEWLVCHHDARHNPPIRTALNALQKVLIDNRSTD